MPVLFLFLLPHHLYYFPSAAFPSLVFRLLVFPSKTSFTKGKKKGGGGVGWGFPCGLVVRIWAFTAMALDSILDLGTVSPAVWCGQKKKP